MSQFTGSPVDLSTLSSQAPQTSDQDVADFTRVAQQLKITPNQPEHIGEADPERFQAVATALKSMGPDMLDRLHDDPAGASATLDSWIRQNIQGDQSVGTPQSAQAMNSAYQAVYAQRPTTVPGGKYDQQQYMQWLASQRGGVGNFAAGFSQGMANVGLDVMGAVAPQTANNLGQRVNDTYNTDMTRLSGQAGSFVGNTTATLPAMLVPGAAVPAFAAMGAGGARREVAERRAEGQNISGGQEALYAGSSGVIQGVMAHYLGKIMNGSPGQVPLQGLIRSLSPELLQSVQGTDGAILRPLIQRTLLNAGVGATQNEVAMIAQELAKSTEGIAGQNDPGLLDRITANTPSTLATGAAQGAGFSLMHEAKTPGQFGRVEQGQPAEEQQQTPQAPAPQAPLPPTQLAQPEPPPAPEPPETILSDGSDYFDREGHEADRDTPDASDFEGRQLPVDQRLADNPDFTKQLDEQRKQIADSDALLKQVNETLPAEPNGPLQGRLPNNTDLRTGEPEHPAITKLKQLDPNAKVAEPGPHAELFDDVSKATGTKIIPVTSDKAAGFSDPEHPDAVLVNVADPKKGVWNVVAHEVAHTFQYDYPEMFKQLRDRLPQWFKTQAEKTYKGLLAKQGHSEESINSYWKKAGDEEIVSMAFGESAVASKMLQRQLRNSDDGLWNSLRTGVERVLNKFTSRGRIINEISGALRDSVGLRGAASEAPRTGSDRVRADARAYSEEAGFPYKDTENRPLNEAQAKKMAAAYGEMKHDPTNPKVKKSYDAFKNESLAQFEFLQERGVKFEPYDGKEQPYKNSAEMAKDVNDNKHLYVFTGGELPADHPLAEKAGVSINGKELTYNDVFRGVHDYFGHAREGFQFGPRGEDNAFRAHSAMYSDTARPAMATETRGQNSYVNFGPNGEHNRANPTETKYADQKAGLLPDEFHSSEGRQAPRNYLSVGHKNGNEEVWWKDEEGQLKTDKHAPYHTDKMMQGESSGRVDHDAKQISVRTHEAFSDPMAEKRLIATGKQLESKYPGYSVFVEGRGGLLPLHELANGGRLYPTLDKVRAIEEDKPLGEKAKDIYNKATPENGWKFAKAVGDTLRRGLSDGIADFIDPIRVIDRAKPVTEIQLEAYVRLHGGLADRMGKMREYGLRKIFGDAYVDPKTNKPLNREWQLDPVKSAVERLGDNASRAERRKEAYDFTNFSTRLGAAESTIERGDNRVKVETAIAAREKLKGIYDSLPSGTKIKEKFNALLDETAEPGQQTPANEKDAEKNAQKELNKTRKKINEAKKLIADFIELGKSEAVNKTPGEAKGGRALPAPSDALVKAQEHLAVLEKVLDHTQNGTELQPNDLLNRDEIIGIKRKALERPLTGISGENANGFKDIATAKSFIEQAKGEKNYDLASEFLRRYRLMGTAHLDVLVQSGRISNETASKIRKSNEFYTDLHRVMEKVGAIDPGQTAGSGVLHKFRGSNRDIDNPYINQQLTTERSYQTAERNYIVGEFVRQAKEYLPEKPQVVEKEGPDTISVYEKGEKVVYKVNPVLAEAINGWGKHVTPDALRAIGKVTGFPGRMLTAMMSKNPFYQINNVIKDMRSRAIISKESGGLKTLSTELAGFRDSEARHLVEVLGGTFGGRGDFAASREAYEKITRKALNDIAGDSNAILALPKKAWKGYSKFTEFGEAAGRTAEYTAQFEVAKKRGMSDQDARTYAAWRARDLMDFAVSGSLIKTINEIAYVPFLNSGFRGLAKHLETVRNDPKTYAKRMAMFGVLPAMIPAVWAYSQGKEQWEKYKGIPLVQRIMFDNYMVGNQRVVIPRGEMTAAASAVAELSFQNHLSPTDLFRAMAASVVPSQVENPQNLLPMHGVVEAANNYSWFYNRNIIPPDEEGVALDLRKTDSASPLAKALSMMAQKAGMEIDPRKIEHVINTDFGSAGSVVDSASRLADSKGLPASKKIEMLGGYNRLTPGYTDQDVQRVLQAADRYKDSSSPAVKQIKEALSEANKATDVDTRQKFVDEARATATAANEFYDQYGDTLMVVKKVGMDIAAAKGNYDELKTGAERAAYVRDNPDQLKLLREEKTYERVTTRINELRKAMISPAVTASTKAMAGREITRLYGIIEKMSGN